MSALLLWLGLAFAGPLEDLQTAANADLSEEARMHAFNQLVLDFDAARPQLEAVVFDDGADARQRWIVARVMGQTQSEAAKKDLLKLCDDPMPAMRAAAAALGDMGHKDTADRLGQLLVDEAVIVRIAAADALGQIGAQASARYLEAALRDSSNFYRGQSLPVRRHYVWALGAIGSETSIPALIACFDDKDDEVALAALESLRQIVGYDFAEGRTQAEHMEAWRRWYAARQ